MRTLSGGTRQKVSASLAFLFNPKVLILDEPTAGLDPVSSEILKEKIRKEKAAGKLILITSHILSDLDDIVSELIYMQEGKWFSTNPLNCWKKETGEERLSRAIANVMSINSFMKKIVKYVILDILRNRIIIGYTLLLMALSFSVFNMETSASKGVLSLLNVILIIVPLVSIIFSTITFIMPLNLSSSWYPSRWKEGISGSASLRVCLLPFLLRFCLDAGYPSWYLMEVMPESWLSWWAFCYPSFL